MVLQPKFLRALQEKEIRSVGSTHTTHLSIRIISATNSDLETAVKNNTFRQDLLFRLNVLQLTIPPLRERKADIRLLAMSFLQKLSESGNGSWTISEDAMKHLACYDWPGNVRELEHAIEYCVAFCSRSRIEVDDLPLQIRQKHGEDLTYREQVLDLDELKRRAIASALAKTKGDRVAAARILGIGKTTLYRKLKQDQQETKHSLTAPPIVHIA
jgi:two-component system response regulator AtoC